MLKEVGSAEMSFIKTGRLPKDPLGELALDASWIRIYVLLPCSVATNFRH
jgi:hypothetical protein